MRLLVALTIFSSLLLLEYARGAEFQRQPSVKSATQSIAAKGADEELKYRRENDQKQLKIQERIADLTGKLVWIGGAQVAVAAIGLLAIGVAYKSITVADRGLRSVERAWVGVGLSDKEYRPKPEPHVIGVVLSNGGKTPARIKEVRAQITIANAHKEFDHGPIPKGLLPTITTIFAGESPTHIISTRQMDRNHISDVIEGKLMMIVHGYVMYDDIFDVRHITRFYQLYSPGTHIFMFPRDADPRHNEAT